MLCPVPYKTNQENSPKLQIARQKKQLSSKQLKQKLTRKENLLQTLPGYMRIHPQITTPNKIS